MGMIKRLESCMNERCSSILCQRRGRQSGDPGGTLGKSEEGGGTMAGSVQQSAVSKRDWAESGGGVLRGWAERRCAEISGTGAGVQSRLFEGETTAGSSGGRTCAVQTVKDDSGRSEFRR